MTTMIAEMTADPTALVGFAAFDRDGEELGEIEGVYLGTEEPEWAAILVGTRFVIVPLLDAEIFEDSLTIPYTAAEVAGAPLQQEELLEDLTEEQEDVLVTYFSGDMTGSTTGSTTGSPTETAKAAGAEVASTARDQGQEVAAAAKDHGQQVASSAKEETARVASTAKYQTQQVASTAKEQASEVVGTAKQQASQVVETASAEARNLLEETRARIEDQTAESAQKLGENLFSLGTEAMALADGRPEEAPTLQRYVRRAGENLLDAADRAYGLSDDVRTRGIASLLGDVQTFARRRPGAFLVGTAVVGVMAGRAVRNAKEAEQAALQDDTVPAIPRGTNGRSTNGRSTNGRATTSRAGTQGAR